MKAAWSDEFSRIERRLTATLVALSALLVAVFLIVFTAASVARVRQERERLATVPARLLAPALVAAKAAGQFRMQRLAEDALASDPTLRYVRVVDATGVVAHAGPVPPGAAMSRFEGSTFRTVTVDGRGVAEATVPLVGGFDDEWHGTLQVGVESASLSSVLASAGTLAAAVALLLLALAIPLTRLVARRLSDPMRRLVAAIEATDECVMVVEPGPKVAYANPALLQKTGLRREAVLGQSPVEVLGGDVEARTRLEALRVTPTWQGRVKARNDAGERWECIVAGAAIPDTALEVWVARDVSRESGLEAQLRQAQKMEAIGQLAGGVAHDFNNLLTVLLTNTQILKEDTLTADQRETVEMIEAAGARAADLTRQLLTFSRRQVVQVKIVKLGEAVQRAAQLLRRTLGTHIALSLDVRPDAWLIRADAGQLEQVVMNLAINARDAMPGGGKLAITVSNATLDATPSADGTTAPAGEYVVLSVSDTGTGMSPETQARIFEPFFTTKDPGRGTGLGLATVLGIVRHAGGFVWVSSLVGQGSTFRIGFPRAPADSAEPAAPAPVVEGGRGERVLLVEDDAAVRAVLERMLKSSGYQVTTATDGLDALEQLRAGLEPAVVLTDLVMPRMGGLELLDALQLQGPVPVVLMSGYSAEVIDLGGRVSAPLILKPPSRPEVLAALRQALDAARSRAG